MVTDENKGVYAQEEPDIAELAKEYQGCTPHAFGWDRLRDNEDIRFCRWDNQHADGKKRATSNKPAFPWEGASDTQIHLADGVINENVAIMLGAFMRSVALAKGVEPNDHEQAAYYTKLLEWLTGTKNDELMEDVELSANYLETYGPFVLHPTWERKVKLKRDKVTLKKLAEAASQLPPEHPLMMLVQLIANEETEPQAVALVQEFGAHIARTAAETQLNGEDNDLFDNYEIKAKTARKFVRELRNGKQSSLPIPYICKNQPSIKALKLWDEVFIPPYVTDIQEAPYVFVRCKFSEQELRSKAALDGWDQEWVEEAVKQAGVESTWAVSRNTETTTATISSGEGCHTWLQPEDTEHKHIEVVYAYTQELDEDDIPSIYYTIFHANITKKPNGNDPSYAKREPLNYEHKKMPFVVGMRERWHRCITSSRGVPQMLASRQRELKVQRDALVDSTSMSVLPPINIPSTAPGAKYVFGPAVQNTVMPGREPKFMEIPVRESAAFELEDRMNRSVKEDFGMLDAEISPTRVQVKQQKLINSFLRPWTLAMQQAFALTEQFLPDHLFMEITGSQKPLPKGEEIALQKDFILTFDVREMDVEHILKEFKAIAEGVLPYDREGVVSSAKFVRAMLRAVNPALAKEITLDGNSASQQIAQRVETDFVNMAAGMPPRLTPDDNPTASAEIQVAEGILQQNQKMQKMFQSDPDFQQKVQQWMDNRSFNMQQQQNKTTGRMGVAA